MSDIKKALHYNPQTGEFTRRCNTNRWLKGEIAGHKEKQSGYIRVHFNNKLYQAHVLAWAYMTGYYPKFPEEEIDHIDHIRHNNKWNNLRLSNKANNQKNATLSKANKSGVSGAGFHSRDRIWFANIRVDSKLINLKISVDKFECICARKSAELKYNFHSNHGQVNET